jgi:hypothetical protein
MVSGSSKERDGSSSLGSTSPHRALLVGGYISIIAHSNFWSSLTTVLPTPVPAPLNPWHFASWATRPALVGLFDSPRVGSLGFYLTSRFSVIHHPEPPFPYPKSSYSTARPLHPCLANQVSKSRPLLNSLLIPFPAHRDAGATGLSSASNAGWMQASTYLTARARRGSSNGAGWHDRAAQSDLQFREDHWR